jgi:DeoR/GlpR family transcriptional regulator of sugar metabolism/ABC-type sugar transport system substrate-binding protein
VTTFERRQSLLALVRKQPGIRVPEIAKILGVSQGTVRNDLKALAAEKELTRVRGGAVLSDDHKAHSPAFVARARTNEAIKRRIARWAADLVEDNDSILLDASTSVYYMARFLKDCHRLTVITNGIEVARELAQNPSNTVILLGGVLRPDGTSITKVLSEQVLQDLHIKTAFVSCSGFLPDTGLTEVDIHEAQLKNKMIASASSVVALIDSSKFGKVDLTPFARTEQISHIFTDSSLDPHWIEQLEQMRVALTVCDEDTVSAFTPSGPETRHYRIGFANLTEQEPLPVDVRRGLERAAREAGNIDLVLADNQLSGEVALQVAERFAAQNLDLVIEYQIDERMGSRIMNYFQRAGIPVIAVDIPMVGATFFGVDNYRAGYLAGVPLGHRLKAHWDGCFDRLIILEEPRAGALPAARIQGMLDGLQSVIGPVPPEKRLTLNSGNASEISEREMTAALKRLPDEHRLAVISFNDDAAIGALMAARQLRREADVAIVGQGADRRVREELCQPGSRIVGSTAYEPVRYGEKLIPLALKILRGEPVPPAVYMEHTFIGAAPETENA